MSNKRHVQKLLVLSLVAFLGVFVSTWFIWKSESLSANCGDFDSYRAVMQAFKLGNTKLDGKDHDGVPCEYMK